MKMIEHMNVIDTLSLQITALLDLMMMAEESVDIQSIKDGKWNVPDYARWTYGRGWQDKQGNKGAREI